MITLQRLRPCAWLAAEVATVLALTGLGSRPPFAAPHDGIAEWLRTAPPADVVVAALRWVALAGAWWLLAGTLLYVAASLTRVPAAVRAVRWAALPAVRRAVDAACAVSLVAGAVLVPTAAGAATGDATVTTTVRDGHSGGLASLPAAPAPVPATTASAPTAAAPAPTPAPSPAAATIVLVAGDNLWEVSARHLADVTGRARADVSDAEVAPYWVTVCDRNRATLVSGDPNLVFPGEGVTFPPVN
jgi:resuscitation-promoting factor RpfA